VNSTLKTTAIFAAGFMSAFAAAGTPLLVSETVASRVSYALKPCRVSVHVVDGLTLKFFSPYIVTLKPGETGVCVNDSDYVTITGAVIEGSSSTTAVRVEGSFIEPERHPGDE
jgi:hypothetical protein